MTAMRRTLLLGLVVLLAATPAAADIVITADEVIYCSVESADADSVRLKRTRPQRRALSGHEAYALTWRQRKVLSTSAIYEIRLSDSNRVAELATRLPQVRVTLDSGQSVPAPAVRIREMTGLRLDRARESRAKGLPGQADVVDTLVRNASPAEMVARCRDMGVVLRECGWSDQVTAGLLREIDDESTALRMVWQANASCFVTGALYGLGGCLTGGLVGQAIDPMVWFNLDMSYGGCGPIYGLPIGCVVGSAIGASLGMQRLKSIIGSHRVRVNDLVRRVNRALSSAP